MTQNLIQTFYNFLKSEQEELQSPNPSLHPWQGEATVDEPILPGQLGRVRFQGSWWPARSAQNSVLPIGGIVRVVGIENITLLVE